MAKYLNLRMMRKSLGLTQFDLAKQLQVAQGYISELEQGKKNMSEDLMQKLKDTFGTEIVEPWLGVMPEVQQNVDGEVNNFSDSGDVMVQETNAIPMEAFNKMIDEISEQRKLVAKSQEQIDRLLNLLERK